tara:strand:+ start:362 stop:682 length:321 start_codon:yes stop_codon:yes gene_type:complete
MSKSNRLCNAYIPNTNPKSSYAGFRIATVLELADPEGGTFIETVEDGEEFLDLLPESLDDPFYRVIAIYKEGHYRASRIIGEFFAINEAASFIQELTGSNVDIYSY